MSRGKGGRRGLFSLKGLSPEKVAQHRARVERAVRSLYIIRRQSGFETFGFLGQLYYPPAHRGSAFLREDYRGLLHDHALGAPMHWQILSIAYFDDGRGTLYREWDEERTHQSVVARGDGLVPFLRRTMDKAESRGNARHLVDRATVMKPWSPAWPFTEAVLRKHQAEMGLEDHEVTDPTLKQNA